MGDGWQPEEIRAAGTILWRHRAGEAEAEVALIHRPRYDDWSFPKGKSKPGEHPLITAAREVAEETGVRPVLGRPLGVSRYQVCGRPKRVDYWAATVAPRHLPGPAESAAPDEVDKLVWLPAEDAMRRLSYEQDAEILREFTGAPNTTIPYIFLRHASAGSKGSGPSDDRLRPLDDAGFAEAAELANLLRCFGSARAFSSATVRCVETLLPYAFAAGVPVTAEPALSWGAGDSAGARDEAARARLASLLTDGSPTIVCGHGETLPHLLAQACAHFGASVPRDASLAKATFWILHVAPREAAPLVAMEWHSVG